MESINGIRVYLTNRHGIPRKLYRDETEESAPGSNCIFKSFGFSYPEGAKLQVKLTIDEDFHFGVAHGLLVTVITRNGFKHNPWSPQFCIMWIDRECLTLLQEHTFSVCSGTGVDDEREAPLMIPHWDGHKDTSKVWMNGYDEYLVPNIPKSGCIAVYVERRYAPQLFDEATNANSYHPGLRNKCRHGPIRLCRDEVSRLCLAPLRPTIVLECKNLWQRPESSTPISMLAEDSVSDEESVSGLGLAAATDLMTASDHNSNNEEEAWNSDDSLDNLAS